MTVDVGSFAEFASGEARRVDVAGRAVVVVRVGDDVFALEDRCSHEEYPLSDGFIDDASCEIECARHGAMFSLRDGSPLSLPATRPVPVVAVRVEDGRVVVTP